MELDKVTLKNQLQWFFDPGNQYPDQAGAAAQAFADRIDAFVKTGSVTVSVTSVSGVTPGAGVSGPGAGTGVIS